MTRETISATLPSGRKITFVEPTGEDELAAARESSQYEEDEKPVVRMRAMMMRTTTEVLDADGNPVPIPTEASDHYRAAFTATEFALMLDLYSSMFTITKEQESVYEASKRRGVISD